MVERCLDITLSYYQVHVHVVVTWYRESCIGPATEPCCCRATLHNVMVLDIGVKGHTSCAYMSLLSYILATNEHVHSACTNSTISYNIHVCARAMYLLPILPCSPGDGPKRLASDRGSLEEVSSLRRLIRHFFSSAKRSGTYWHVTTYLTIHVHPDGI